MEEEILSAKRFFREEAIEALDRLSAEAKPEWGIMTSQHMIEHLIVTYKMSIGRIKIPLAVKPEDVERNKGYLIKDAPMRRNVVLPSAKNELQPLRFDSLQSAVDKLKEEVIKFEEFMEQNPDFATIHPFGGAMNAKEWLLFHRKHFKHHLIQFGLIPDYE